MMRTLNDFVGADMGDVDRYVLKQGSTMVGGVPGTFPSREQTERRRNDEHKNVRMRTCRALQQDA